MKIEFWSEWLLQIYAKCVCVDKNRNWSVNYFDIKCTFQNTANVYEYLYKHMGSFGLFEFILLPEWKKAAKVKNAVQYWRYYNLFYMTGTLH